MTQTAEKQEVAEISEMAQKTEMAEMAEIRKKSIPGVKIGIGKAKFLWIKSDFVTLIVYNSHGIIIFVFVPGLILKCRFKAIGKW